MRNTDLGFILRRVPKSDANFFEAVAIEFCSYTLNNETLEISDVEVLSGKFAGRYLNILPSVTYDEVYTVYPLNIDSMLEIFDYDSVTYFIEDYNSGKLGHFVYRLDYKNDLIEYYFAVHSVIKKPKTELKLIDKTSLGKTKDIKNEVEVPLDEIDHVYKKVTDAVVGQDEAVKRVLSSIYTNQKLIHSNLSDEKIRNLKQNVLLAGSTGTGKSEIVKQIGKALNVPVVIEDATKYTSAGYIGGNVEDMIKHLVSACDNDLEKAEKAILVVDEIDKKAGGTPDSKGIESTAVQNGLLKLVEGGVMHIDADRNTFLEDFDFDTSKLTIIFSGAFSDITQKSRVKKDIVVGFNTGENPKKEEIKHEEFNPEDFIKLGMTPEFMGRISNIVVTNSFNKEDYRNILLNSNISPLALKKELFKSYGIDLTYNEEFIDKVTEEAVRVNTGARGLKLVFEKEFEKFEYEVLKGDITTINLGSNEPELVRVLKK